MLLSTVQDNESDAGIVLGLTGQRHRVMPIRRHNGGADVFHFTSGKNSPGSKCLEAPGLELARVTITRHLGIILLKHCLGILYSVV